MDTQATVQVWNEFAKQLKGYLIAKTKNAEAAEDLLQDVFVRIHQGLNQMKDHARLRSWVFSIAHHALMDYYRKMDKHGETLLAEETELPDTTEEKSMHNCIYPFIERLPPPYRDTLQKTELEGLKYKQLADEEKVSLSAIKSRVQRGREMIRDMFVQCCHFTIDEAGKLKGEHRDPDTCTICNAKVSTSTC